MKKLFGQVVGFGIIGVLALLIDVGVMNALMLALSWPNVVAATISFIVSLAFNYVASMKFVFTHRQDMARWMEMLIFLVSSVIGLLMNIAIIWLSTWGMPDGAVVSAHAEYALRSNIGKLVATVVVAVWNFVIRKWLLDASHTGNETVDRNSFAHRLGVWSLEHTPKGWQ